VVVINGVIRNVFLGNRLNVIISLEFFKIKFDYLHYGR